MKHCHIRGGSWDFFDTSCNSAYRLMHPMNWMTTVNFRIKYN